MTDKPMIGGYVRTVKGKGIKTTAANLPGLNRMPKTFQRGKITGWSAHSRGRLRETIFRTEPPEGWITSSCTFTIPPPEMTLQESVKLWRDFRDRTAKRGWAMIWRVEVQKRGQLHWHTIGFQPASAVPIRDWSSLWHECLRIGPIDRMRSRGAYDHAAIVDVQWEQRPNKSGWYRYLCDHASKRKQEQIGEGIGRHWGVVGRKVLREVTGDLASLDYREWARFLRMMQRLTAGTERSSCVFGRRRRRVRFARGRRGSSVWFGNTDTQTRLLSWAKAAAASAPNS